MSNRHSNPLSREDRSLPPVSFVQFTPPSNLLRTLDVSDWFSSPYKDVYHDELLFFVRIHIAMNKTRRNMEEISLSYLDRASAFQAVFQSHTPRLEKSVEMPSSVVVPI